MSIREQLDVARTQEYVSVNQLALLLSISPKTVRRHLHEFPFVLKTTRLIRIHRAQAIRAWMTEKPAVKLLTSTGQT